MSEMTEMGEYQDWTFDMRRGGMVDNPLPIAITGLCGEAGEVAEIVKKMWQAEREFPTDEEVEAIKLELGDTLFYLVSVADWMGLSVDEIIEANIEKITKKVADIDARTTSATVQQQ